MDTTRVKPTWYCELQYDGRFIDDVEVRADDEQAALAAAWEFFNENLAWSANQ